MLSSIKIGSTSSSEQDSSAGDSLKDSMLVADIHSVLFRQTHSGTSKSPTHEYRAVLPDLQVE